MSASRRHLDTRTMNDGAAFGPIESAEAARRYRQQYRSMNVRALEDLREDLIIEKSRIQREVADPAMNDRDRNGMSWRQWKDWRQARTDLLANLDMHLRLIKRIRNEKLNDEYADNNGWPEGEE